MTYKSETEDIEEEALPAAVLTSFGGHIEYLCERRERGVSLFMATSSFVKHSERSIETRDLKSTKTMQRPQS